jgi:dTMP kinase
LIEAPAPDLTLVLDIAPERGLARSQGARAGEDRFEQKALGFHERVRAEFLAIAQREPERCAVIDASADAPAVLAHALATIEQRL